MIKAVSVAVLDVLAHLGGVPKLKANSEGCPFTKECTWYKAEKFACTHSSFVDCVKFRRLKIFYEEISLFG